jgi:hypothetical protein
VTRWLLVLAALLGLGGCGGVDRAFRQEDAVRITAPHSSAPSALPVTVTWSAGASPDARRYAVFVDRAPMPPGKTLGWLARGDDACRSTPTCPDEAWLNDHAVYTASKPSLVVRAVPSSVLGDRSRSDGGHRLVLVELDGAGRRINEQVATRLFFVEGA